MAFKRKLGEDGETLSRYVVDDTVYQTKLREKDLADLTKAPSQ